MRRLRWELLLVAAVSLAVLVPGIWSYSLVDPWETHYGEVARNMVKDGDLVHMQWPGTNADSAANEGFRSKPVLPFWMMAAGMRAAHLASDGYSGEMVHDARTMVAIRMPFIVAAVIGLVCMWWMLARLVRRRLAWLALLVVGSCPFFCLVARQAIPDMPLCACVMGAISMFALALEDGGREITPLFRIRHVAIDARHVVLAVCGAFMAAQAIYAIAYFAGGARVVVPDFPSPAVFFPVLIALLFGALWQTGWMVFRWYAVIVGSLVAFAVSPQHRFRAAAVDEWDAYAPDRFVIRVLALPVAWASRRTWASTNTVADRALAMRPITSMRQVYLLWCYAFLGVSILAKGPPGLAVVGLVGVAHVVLERRWRALYEGELELKRGLLLMIAIFLPWHIGMFLTEGINFINEYVFQHLVDRAAIGSVDKSFGTFEHYTSQLGHGMWLWAALIPVALGAALMRSTSTTREGRVRFLVALWAICGFAFFALVQTKFHHYILPVVPALAILVAFVLDDVWARRERVHPLYALLGIAIVLLIARDLAWEPERWIEMFVYRYDRPWPSAEPYAIDPSDGFLGLGLVGAVALALLATPWRRTAVAALGVAGITICLWSLHVYMPIAATHWGSRDAIRRYYEDRTIYGEKLVYFGPRELYDDWHDVHDTWSFETFVPRELQIAQPMTITVELDKRTVALVGSVERIGDHSVDVVLAPGERAKLEPLVRQGANAPRSRRPVRAVDADRLIAWQLYWRGDQFWSGGEIWDWLPEMKTTFAQNVNNNEITKYLGDRARAPLGRRYFFITDNGRANSVRSLSPTQRGRDTFEILETTSNKFTLSAFYL